MALSIICIMLTLSAKANTPDPFGPGLLEAESPDYWAFTGSWGQLVNGDYVVIESQTAGDSVTLTFEGSSVIVYRELIAQPTPSDPAGAQVEICISGDCTTISNRASEDQRRAPIAFQAEGTGTHELTLTNIDGGILRLDYVVVPYSQPLAQTQAPSPTVHHWELETGRIVAIDFSVTAGDVAVMMVLSIILMLNCGVVLVLRSRDEM